MPSNSLLARLILACTALTFAAVTIACSDDDSSGGASPSGTGAGNPETTATAPASLEPSATGEAAAATEDAFPVTIEHKYGSVTIEEQPERVVSVGFQEQDTIVALGIEPVAVREWWNEQPFATWIWARDELGDAQPVVLPSGELDMEAVAGLNPDVIIAPYGGLTQDEYNLLSAIAPTISQPAEYEDYTMPWREQTLLIGKALGKEAEAQALVDEADAKFEAVREEHPEFTGKTFVIAGSNLDGTYWLYGVGDPRSRLFADLGMELPEGLVAEAGDEFYATVSAEQASLLDTDVLIWFPEAEEMQALANDPVFQQLEAVKDGRIIYVPWDSDLAGALSFTSVLSLPYAVDEIVPQIAEAVAKLP